MKIGFFLTLALFATALPVEARLNVVATTSSMGMLVRTVGGDAVDVTVLAPPDRDAHYLQARPSMLLALRRADLLVTLGAELEVGWLPAALQGAANPRILPGRSGYFEGAAQVPLLETGAVADRAHGDVHPAGNPHINLDPMRMAEVARALAGRLASLYPAGEKVFAGNAERFGQQVAQRLPAWQARTAKAPGVVMFHKDANYLLNLLGVPVLGYIEPLPGIPPTAQHLQSLVTELQSRSGVVIRIVYQPTQGPEFVGRALNWPVHALPLDPPLGADAEAYLKLIDSWVDTLAGKI